MNQRFETSIKTFLLLIFLVLEVTVNAQREYPASMFGIRSNGTTLNTASIQAALDYIGEQGGGTLVFEVGRYLTGSICLRDSVNICLREGAVLVGSDNPYDYHYYNYSLAYAISGLILAVNVENVHIFGKGVIEMPGDSYQNNYQTLSHNGCVGSQYANPDSLVVFDFFQTKNIQVDGIFCKNQNFAVTRLVHCKNVQINNLTVNRLPNSVECFSQFYSSDCEVTALKYWPEKGK